MRFSLSVSTSAGMVGTALPDGESSRPANPIAYGKVLRAAGVVAALLLSTPAEAATYHLTLTEVPFSGVPTGRVWTGWMEITPGGVVSAAEISLPGLSYLYPDMQTYSLPMYGLSRGADGVLRGYLASAERPLPAPALLFESGYWYSGEADIGSAFACTSCLPRGTYALERPAEVPLPAGLLLLATPLAALLTRRKR